MKSFSPFQYHFHVKKSNSLKNAGIALTGAGRSSHSSRLPEDLEGSDDLSEEEDDDTVSSGLSGNPYPLPCAVFFICSLIL